MKKIFKICITNLLIIFCVVVFIEFTCICIHYPSFSKHLKAHRKLVNLNTNYSFIEHLIKTKDSCIDKKYLKYTTFRPTTIPEPNLKPSIVLLGGSFAYGLYLDENQAFHKLLSNKTNRTVYNWSVAGGSPREALYIAENFENIFKLQNDEIAPEYVMYTYIADHKRRLFIDMLNFQRIPYYKKVNNGTELEIQDINPIITNSQLYKYIRMALYRFISKETQFKLYSLYMKEIKKEIHQKLYNSNPQFIVLIYNEDGTENWEELKNQGIKIINLSEISNVNLDDNEYKMDDNFHPNAKAWDVIVSALAKELNL